MYSRSGVLNSSCHSCAHRKISARRRKLFTKHAAPALTKFVHLSRTPMDHGCRMYRLRKYAEH